MEVAAPPAVGSGRASHRGGARGEPRPGGDAPVAAMAAMSIEPGGGDRRNRFEYFEERTTRPEHVKDKRGTICLCCCHSLTCIPIKFHA